MRLCALELPITTPFAPRPDDAIRQAQLDAMKRRATGLLLAAALIFLAASWFEPQYAWLGYVRATAEASVVGGLADWFAVTALFRHPLGIPIPHTAIIGRQKDRIGRIIGNFVQHHFLARDAVSAKLRGMRIAERGAEWLSRPENSQRIAVQLASGVARTLEALPDEKIRLLIQEGARDRIRATRVAPVLGKTLAMVVAGDRHQELLNEAIRIAAKAVHENEETIRRRVCPSSRRDPFHLLGRERISNARRRIACLARDVRCGCVTCRTAPDRSFSAINSAAPAIDRSS